MIRLAAIICIGWPVCAEISVRHMNAQERPRSSATSNPVSEQVALARQLGLRRSAPFLVRDGEAIGCIAKSPLTRAALRRKLESRYARVIAIECGSPAPKSIAFCSGAGNSAVPELVSSGVDTLVTGELREEFFNRAQEEKLNLYCCGHYATEVHAVRALAAELAKKFRLPWEFIATDNPL